MILLYLWIAILVPLMPALVALRASYAPAGGTMAFIALQMALGVTMKTIYTYMAGPLAGADLSAPWFQRSEVVFQGALIYMVLFSAAICVGYLAVVRQGQRFQGFATIGSLAVSDRAALVLTALSIALFAFLLVLLSERRAGLAALFDNFSIAALAYLNAAKLERIDGVSEFGASHSFLFQFLDVITLTFIVLVASALTRRPSAAVLLGIAVMLALLLFEALIRGRRVELAIVMIQVMVLIVFMRRRLTLADLATVFGLGVGLLVVFAFMSYFRSGVVDDVGLAHFALVESILDPVLASTYFTDINMVATIMERMEGQDFKFGESFAAFLTGLIPREFWPDKPAITLGLFVKSDLFGIRGTIGGYAPTLPGESYINFGWFGVLVGLFYGAALRGFEVALLSERALRRWGGFWLYIALLPIVAFSIPQSSFAIGMVATLATLIICLPITAILAPGRAGAVRGAMPA